jgi:uncharacterized integral membrane protein
MPAKILIALIVIGLLLIVLAQNAQVVTLKFLLWQVSMSQIILLLFTVLTGFVLGWIVAKMARGSRRRS